MESNDGNKEHVSFVFTGLRTEMLNCRIYVAALMVAAFPASSWAQVPGSRITLSGGVQQVITDHCYVNDGIVTYERDFRAPPVSGTKSLVSFSELFVGTRNSNQGWDLKGLAVLKFNTRSSGTILFKHTGLRGQFSNYEERRRLAAGQLNVSFTLALPEKECSLPIAIQLEQSMK